MAPFTSNVRTAKRVPCSSEAAPDLHPPGPSASHGDTQPPPPAHTIPGAAQYVWPWTARISHHVPSAKLRVMNRFFSPLLGEDSRWCPTQICMACSPSMLQPLANHNSTNSHLWVLFHLAIPAVIVITFQGSLAGNVKWCDRKGVTLKQNFSSLNVTCRRVCHEFAPNETAICNSVARCA